MSRDLFLALDLDDKAQALELVHKVSEFITGIKIGPRMGFKYGADIVSELAKIKPVFIDNKYFDIPNTMLASVRSSFNMGASFCTVHAQSGPEALKKLADLEAELNKTRAFKVLVVTVLTSFNKETMPVNCIKASITEQVQALAHEAYGCGLRSFVCSALEVEALKNNFPGCYFVTPGIRFPEESAGDQKRVVGPKQAFNLGASAIVVGRPIYEASDPVEAAKKYYEALGL